MVTPHLGSRLAHRVNRRFILSALLLLVACGPGWQAAARCDSRLANPSQQVRIWVGSHSTRLHGLRITADSVSGIPFLQPLKCDSCRIVFPAAEVDSIQAGDPPGGLLATSATLLFAVVVYALFTGGLGQGST